MNSPPHTGNLTRGKTLPGIVLGLLGMAAILVLTPIVLGLALIGWLLRLISRALGLQGPKPTRYRPAPRRSHTVIEGEYEVLTERP